MPIKAIKWLRTMGRSVVLGSAVLMLAGTPAMAGHCCKSVATIQLAATDPIATPRLRGTASVLDCFGVVTMLSVTVAGPVPDGTTYAPAVVGVEPLLGDFFSMMNKRGEGFIVGVSLPQVQGRTVSVFDQNFTEVLTGTF